MTREEFELDLTHAEAVLTRYEGPSPRYTSYPTAPVWTEAYERAQFAADLAQSDVEGARPLSLYVHVPFCRSLCHFCACNRLITRDPALPERYLDVIAREIAAARDRMPCKRTATQIHWGGGTPTHLSPGQLRHLFGTLVEAFPLERRTEVSIEVDPRVTTQEQVETLRELGFGRISMGVQDFEPRVQAAIHRIQPASETARLVELSRRLGFERGNTTQSGVDVVGFGPSAISALRGSYAQSERDLGAWESAVRSHGLATKRGHRLTQEDLRRRWIIEGIMCQGELCADEYAAHFGSNFAADYSAELRALGPLAADGLVEIEVNGTLRTTALGRLLVRNLAMRFDAYLGEQQRVGSPLFSKAV